MTGLKGSVTLSRKLILIADDQPDVQEALRLLLKGEGYRTEVVSSPREVLKTLQNAEVDLLLMDLNYTRDTTSGEEGLELLSKIAVLDEKPPVVVMTAWGTVELVVEAMRRGAIDFVEKPWDNARVLSIVRTQLALSEAVQGKARLEAATVELRGDSLPTLIAGSAAMQPVMEMISRVGPTDVNVLITGENGTGKGLVAQLIHAASDRKSKAIVTVNIGGLSENLFESELFGHVKGAFTDAKADRLGRFELAEGSTLFLDEIGNVPSAQQSKLLRVLETGEFERVGSSKTRKVDVRLITATNSDLRAEVNAGRFRQDLLFRLNTIELRLPPLRERRDDILKLAMYFLGKHCRRYRRPIEFFDPDAQRALNDCSWPGNVRELSHAVERGVLMARGNSIGVRDLGLIGPGDGDGATRLEEMSIEEVERFLIKKTLARCDGNARQAAEVLGLSRSAFYRRLEKYKL
ncbi:MAG: zraR 4 [Verrucomicrobiales bacterium]|nr:zraR 4 [Verrucomicrobiales bacterium]